MKMSHFVKVVTTCHGLIGHLHLSLLFRIPRSLVRSLFFLRIYFGIIFFLGWNSLLTLNILYIYSSIHFLSRRALIVAANELHERRLR